MTTDPVHDEARLAAVRATGLLDTPPEEAFDQLGRLATRVLGTPYAFVTLVDDTRSFWKTCIGVTSEDPTDRQNTVEESFCQYVVNSDAALVVGDVTQHPMTRSNPSIESMGVRAWAGYPVRDEAGHVLGTMCAVDTVARDWTADDEELLRMLADSAGNVIRLRNELRRTEDAAWEIRRSLLPPVIEVVPHMDVTALHRSAGGRGTVLGDFYDLFRSGRGRWHAVIGDVCGQGIEAAKFTSLVRWAYQSAADRHDDPAAIFDSVNAVLRRQPAARFVTGQALSFEPDERGTVVARFASAGHHPAVILRADCTVETVEENGWMLGVFEPYEIASVDVELRQGDKLVLFTDGVTEARRGDEQLGFDGVCDALAGFDGDAYELAGWLADLAGGFADDGNGTDDMAVMVVSPRA